MQHVKEEEFAKLLTELQLHQQKVMHAWLNMKEGNAELRDTQVDTSALDGSSSVDRLLLISGGSPREARAIFFSMAIQYAADEDNAISRNETCLIEAIFEVLNDL